jgi:hypothetical protein
MKRLIPAMFIVAATAGLAHADGIRAFIGRHCADCHTGPGSAGGLDLAALQRDPTDRAAVARWVAVHDRLTAGEMPPADADQPPPAERTTTISVLAGWLTSADEDAQRTTGRAIVRRLTATEFEHSLRDLLGLPLLEVRRMLPEDGQRHGFDKIGDGLDLSPVQMEQYLAAVDKALDMSIATRATPPPTISKRFDVAPMLKFKQNILSGAAVLLDGQRPETAWCGDGRKDPDEKPGAPTPALLSGHTVGFFTPKQGGHEKYLSFVPVFPGRYRMRMSVWSFVWNHGAVEPSPRTEVATLQCNTQTLGYFDAPSLEPQVHEVTSWLPAGTPVMFDVASLTNFSGESRDHRPGIAIDWFEAEGPLHESWPPESHRRLFGDLPIAPFAAGTQIRPPARATIEHSKWAWPGRPDIPPRDLNPPLATVVSSDPDADAMRLLSAFLPRAFRRTVAADEVARYVTLARGRLEKGDCFEDAMRQAYRAVLTSPHFLYRMEQPGPLDDHAVATRLALWLWSGPPDTRLLDRAAAGRLRDPAALRSEVERMLDDPRSNRFVADFLDQWLKLADIDDTDPDQHLYPEFQFHYLKESMLDESRMFLRELIAHNLPITSLVTSDFAMLNERLAQHYQIPGLSDQAVSGSRIRRVALPRASHRGGFLTQGAVLKVTANGTTTSPVMRGVFISERILGETIPPPPSSVPAVEPDTRGATTIRDLLTRHQADAACATCHRKIDPPGYALESFDVIGGWRERYRSEGKGTPATEVLFDGRKARFRLAAAVDASGTLPDGTSFEGFEAFRANLASHPEQLARAFATQLVMYATGAEPMFADRAEIDRVVAATADNGHGIRSLIHEITQSRLFLEK